MNFFDEITQRLGGIRPVVGDRLRPMSEAEIGSIESQILMPLPESYRTFLLKYGASCFAGSSENHPFIKFRSLNPLPLSVSKDNKCLFSAFYGADTDSSDPYGLGVRIRYYQGRIPDSMIPIGDSWGSQICLGINGSDTGKVFYWDERDEPEDEQTYLEDFGVPMPLDVKRQNIHLIADSFDDFLNRLEMAIDT